jgi:glucose dehydrogenase
MLMDPISFQRDQSSGRQPHIMSVGERGKMRIQRAPIRSSAALLLAIAHAAFAQNDWPAYGRDPGARRYSPLKQINPSNVDKLVQAWTFKTKPASDAGKQRASSTTALMINNVLYFATPYQSLMAVEPETGKTIWTFDHQHAPRTSRGLAYWPGDRNGPPTIYFGTEDGFLIGVNARTGKLVPGFAKEGELDLKPGMKDDLPNAPYGLNGAPAVYKNLVFTGSHLQDYGSYGGRGDVRAWDAGTGKLVWTFHTVPRPGEPGHETWLDDGWKNRSGVNVWSTFTVDAETGTLLMPIGSPSDDRYGGDRPGANLYGNALVAVDAMTGKLKWYFQNVHHDLWDYDLPPQPTLVDLVKDGQKIPALIQAAKTGLVFILDRRTGKPVFGVEERPVPKGDVPGEWYSPTQPFPLKPPQLARATWSPNDISKFTPEHQKYCEDLFKNAQNDGPYAPVRMTDTVVFPGSDGGFNWGGGSYDPRLGYYFINPRPGWSAKDGGASSGQGTPHGEDQWGRRCESDALRPKERRIDKRSGHGLALSDAAVGRVVRHQCEYRGSGMESALWARRIAGEDRSDEHGLVQYRWFGGDGQRAAVHRGHGRSALPRLRIENRQTAVGNQAYRERVRESDHVSGQRRKTVRCHSSSGDDDRLPVAVSDEVSPARATLLKMGSKFS